MFGRASSEAPGAGGPGLLRRLPSVGIQLVVLRLVVGEEFDRLCVPVAGKPPPPHGLMPAVRRLFTFLTP